MSDVLSNDMLGRIVNAKTGKSFTSPTLTLRLFVNSFTPLCTSILSDFTTCAAPGYADIALVAASWTQMTVSCLTSATYPTQTFILTGQGSPAETIYGHVLFDSTASEVWWSQAWTTPFVIPSGGGAVAVNLYVDDQSA